MNDPIITKHKYSDSIKLKLVLFISLILLSVFPKIGDIIFTNVNSKINAPNSCGVCIFE